jgi:protein-S-isoprenylcysteine O-methyltransferase Ste14
MERIEFPAAIAAYFLIALALPTLRVWRRDRVWPLVFHREANPVARAMGLLFGIFLMALMAWAILYWRVDSETLGVWDAPGWVAITGWFSIALGTIITVVAQGQMGRSWRIGIDDRPTDLIAEGLFAWSRNPIFSGMILTLLGAVLIAPAGWSILFASVTFLLISIQIRFEEKHLVELHGQTYVAYAQKVGRFLPGVGTFPKDGLEMSRAAVQRQQGE